MYEQRQEVLEIQGGKPLEGEVNIPGAKNAILPLMAASVLTNKTCTFKNVPAISDVNSMSSLLRSYGVFVSYNDSNQVRVRATDPQPLPNDLDEAQINSQKFRASIVLLGPLLARRGRARIYIPGGDEIDKKGRPIDFHITNLKMFGATVHEEREKVYPYKTIYVEASAPTTGLNAPDRPIMLPKVSVGATQNTIMAACFARGTTVIEGASIEPETLDLVKFLEKIGAIIQVDKDKRKFTITGKERAYYGNLTCNTPNLFDIEHTVIPDRIVAGTYAIAAAITGGSLDLLIGNFPDSTVLELLESEFWRLLAAGVEITRIPGGFRVARKRDSYDRPVPIKPVNVVTRTYPGFPTDLHPQWAALMCFSDGESWVEETIFDDRFKYVEQLQALNASIFCDEYNNKKVNIYGNTSLRSSTAEIEVNASDIRAGAALILVALARKGVTRITGLHHVDRGYEKVETKFSSVGSKMKRKRIM